MNADDLQDLYNTLRGSRSAMAVLDAKALYMDKDFQSAHNKLSEAHATYQESRTRLLKQDPEKQFAGQKDADRQIRRLKRKQEKAQDVLNVFADLLGQLERQARREQDRKKTAPPAAAKPKPAPPAPEPDKPTEPDENAQPNEQPPSSATSSPEPVSESNGQAQADADSESMTVEINFARPSSVSEKFLDEFQENWGDDQLDVIGRSYGFLQIDTEADIFGDALYFIRKGDESYLVFTPPSEQIGDTVTLTNVVSRKPLSPITPETFVQLGQQRRIVLLLDKLNPVIREPKSEPQPESNDGLDAKQDSVANESETETDQPPAEFERDKQILDAGAFSQLMDAAQRSGLVPGADQIGHVRDREFKKGNYDLALQAIEGLFSKFTANATARSQRLRQEEADIAAGRTKISPKDLQAKRARDRAQDQAVERARSRFNRVLDGLRILMKTS